MPAAAASKPLNALEQLVLDRLRPKLMEAIEAAKAKFIAALGPDVVAKVGRALATVDQIASAGQIVVPAATCKALAGLVSLGAWIGLHPTPPKL